MAGAKKSGANASGPFLVMGLGLMVLGLTLNPAFIGAGALFMILGITGLRGARKSAAGGSGDVSDENGANSAGT